MWGGLSEWSALTQRTNTALRRNNRSRLGKEVVGFINFMYSSLKRSPFLCKQSKPMKRTTFKKRIRLDAAKNSIGYGLGKRRSARTVLRATKPLKRKHRSKVETEWIAKVRERDNFTCRWPGCGYYSKSIHAHHIHTRAQRPDLKREVENGACLCTFHHDRLHHTVRGRQEARALGLLGTNSYEAAMKGQAA